MGKLPRVLVFVCIALLGGCTGSTEPVSMETRTLIEVLADDEFGGRLTGTEGSTLAADYIIEQLRLLGAVPLPLSLIHI